MSKIYTRVVGASAGEALSSELNAQINELGSKSAMIRYRYAELSAAGVAKDKIKGQISRELGIRYQHVRNVLRNPPKKG